MTTHRGKTVQPEIDRRRFDQAQRDLAKMQEEIAPFAKKRESESRRTSGTWRSTRSMLRESARRISR